MKEQKVSNRRPTALITGATKGLGRYLAQTFLLIGYDLILVSKSTQDELEILSKVLLSEASHVNSDKLPLKIFSYSCNLASAESIDDLINTLLNEHSHLDVLINNAAVQGPIGSSADIWANTPDLWREVVQVDMLAPIELASRLLPLLSRSNLKGGASIINMSGGGATGPRANFSAYATSKAGLVRFSETLALELKDHGIRVNCIAPGAMNTAMMQEVVKQGAASSGMAEFEAAQKVIRGGGTSMKRVAELALFLASEASSGVTGRLISAVWDNWNELAQNVDTLESSDLFTLRRIAGRDRGLPWADR